LPRRLVVSGGKLSPRLFDRATQAWRSTPTTCKSGRLTDVREGRAALVSDQGAGTVIDLASASVTTPFPKGAAGGEWLVAHDLEGGRTAAVSRKDLLVFERAD